ncbi:MAG: Na+/H+ antiporter subunit E [Candidatus Izemoplasmataceae bacterium]
MGRFLLMRYKLFLFLLVFWFLLQWNVRLETIIAGIIISVAVTLATFNVLYDRYGYMYHSVKVRTIFVYIGFLFIQIYKASFLFVYNLLTHRYEPIVFEIELDVDDPVLVGIISNSITLTPGTITIETDMKRHTIKVLTLAKPGTTQEELERPIRERFEKLLKQKGDIL